MISVKLYLFLFDANISARASASVLINTTGASIRWQKNIRFSAKRLALIHGAMIGTYAAWSRWLQLLTVAKKAIRCYKRTSILVSIVSVWILCKHTVWNLNFLSKNSTLISRENCRIFGWKTRENVVVLDFLAVDNFDFTRKIVKKIWAKNSWKCVGFLLYLMIQLKSFALHHWCTYVGIIPDDFTMNLQSVICTSSLMLTFSPILHIVHPRWIQKKIKHLKVLAAFANVSF